MKKKEIDKEIIRLLIQVWLTDKTPQYEYGKGNKSKTRWGQNPADDTRYLTPREVVERYVFDNYNLSIYNCFQILECKDLP